VASAKRGELREGFTTGTAAAAAAKAAALLLLGRTPGEAVDVPLPGGGRLAVPLAGVSREGPAARGAVIKDAGDDPDVTGGARIRAVVRLTPNPLVAVEGGRGVGRATLPGLPVPPGRAAINPAPRAQIEAAVREALDGRPGGASVVVEVEGGEELARRTMNPRLGIHGGVSILGTRGTVKPFSHESWAATVSEELSVARALGCGTAFLCTGGRSRRLLRQRFPEARDEAFVQAADFFEHACAEAARLGFPRVVWGVFFGKLVKHAQGMAYTHAHSGELDFNALAALAARAGANHTTIERVAGANTARQALGLLDEAAARRLAGLLAERARGHALAFAGRPIRAEYLAFDLDGRLLHDDTKERT
jgi:cobalt-precorrin-5B (C1)-methyltransferase